MAVTFPQLMQRLAPLGGPLAGREREIEVLRRAWAEAEDGSCRLVLVAGEAGVGKTRLAAELAGEVEAVGGDVVLGTCPAGGAEPYHPLIEALGPVPVGHSDRDTALRELAAAAAARARRTPMLLVLDDVHRTDRSTLLAVRHIVEVDAPLLVVATYRDTAVDRSHPLSDFLAAVVSRPAVERIALEGLRPDALVDLVGDAEVARRVWRQSEGNPVRVRELLRLGSLDRPLPPSFDDLVARRMAGLGTPARRFLEAAAVVGSEFSVDVAAAAAELSADRVPAALKQLAAAGFIVDEPGGARETRRFVHDMVREAIADRLEPLARVRLHLRVGQALERISPRAAAPAALLAWHFRAAAPVGGSLPALRHSTAAADRAMELLAWEEAAVHYGHALAAATGASADVRTDLLLSLGEAQRLAGETARARQAFLEAAKLARSCADGARLARAALALGQVAAAWGADPELEELAGEARSMLGHTGPLVPVFSPETDFASDVLYDVLDGVERQPATPDAAAPPVPHPTADPAAAALLRARHVALAGPEHTPDRLATADELVALADELGDDALAATAWGWGVVDCMELGRLEQAAVHQAAHREVAVRLDDPPHSADVAAWVAMRAMLEGRVDDAGAAATNAFAFASDAGDPEAEESYLLQRWWLALEWGTPDKLTQIANECRGLASASGGGRTWRAAAALALARGGRLDQAAEELRKATDHGLGELIRDPGRLHPLSCLAEVAWLLGDGYRAAAVGPLLEPFADRMIVAGRGLAWRGSVARACGLVAASAYRWDEAEDHFEAALTAHRRMGALPLLARTRFEWSRLLAERGGKGDKRRAADLRRKSADLANRLHMTRLLEELARPAP